MDEAEEKAKDQSGDAAQEAATDSAVGVTLYDSRISDVELKLTKIVDGLAKHGIKIQL
jgi:hypothetical protein